MKAKYSSHCWYIILKYSFLYNLPAPIIHQPPLGAMNKPAVMGFHRLGIAAVYIGVGHYSQWDK